jgi:hypothetical protein
LAGVQKNTPTYLNCHVSIDISNNLEIDLKTKSFYGFGDDDDPDDDDDDETGSRDDDEVRRYYAKQYENNLYQRNQTNVVQAVKMRTKRDAVTSGFSFEWLRDGKAMISLPFDASKTVNVDGFTLFKNGTLKFQATNVTAGEYRCKVKYTKKAESSYAIGPMLSKTTMIEAASKLTLYELIEETMQIIDSILGIKPVL